MDKSVSEIQDDNGLDILCKWGHILPNMSAVKKFNHFSSLEAVEEITQK